MGEDARDGRALHGSGEIQRLTLLIPGPGYKTHLRAPFLYEGKLRSTPIDVKSQNL